MSDRAGGIAVTVLSRVMVLQRTKSVGCIAYVRALLGDFSEGPKGVRKKDSCRVNNKSNGTERAKAIAGPTNHISLYKAAYAGVSF